MATVDGGVLVWHHGLSPTLAVKHGVALDALKSPAVGNSLKFCRSSGMLNAQVGTAVVLPIHCSGTGGWAWRCETSPDTPEQPPQNQGLGGEARWGKAVVSQQAA